MKSVQIQQHTIIITITSLLGFAQIYFKNVSYTHEEIAMVDQPAKYLGEVIEPHMIEPFLGLKLLASDLIWIDMLIKTNNAEKNREYSNYFQAAKNLNALNPYNYLAAHHNGLILSAIARDLKGATAIFETGCESLKRTIELDPNYVGKFKGIWSLFMMASYHMIFETLNFDDGRKWLKYGSEIKGAPAIMGEVLELVNTSEGRNKVASAILNEMYKNAQSEDEKKILKEKILNIARDQEIVDLNEKYETFLKTTGASKLSKEQSFNLFLRSYHIESKDSFGRKFFIDEGGKIRVK